MVTDQDRLVAGRYRLSEKIGRGGMGTVWLAQDQLLDRLVAVKKLHVPMHLADDEMTKLYERTRREARSAARISHNSVTVVHDVVEDEGLPCIVMEYVRSRALSHVVREDGPLAPEAAARVGLAMAGALRAAHSAGVMHRDVKPANVLLSEDGRRIVLTDFGIAAASGTTTLTRTGEFIGSVNYSSPERVQGGESLEPADAWALGATLYEAAEGVPPFHRDTWMETAFAIATDAPRPMERAGALQPLIEGLLGKDPQQRVTLASAEEWLREAAATLELPYGTGGVSGTGGVGGTSGTAPTQPHAEASAVSPQPAAESAAESAAEAGTEAGGDAPEGADAEPAPSPETATATASAGSQATATATAPRRRRRRRGLFWTAFTLVVAGASVAAYVFLPEPGWMWDHWVLGKSDAQPPAQADKPPASQAPATPGPAPATPEGYHRVHDQHGFTVDVPRGWRRKVESNGHDVSYISPSEKSKLMFSVLDLGEMGPMEHWQKIEPEVRSKSPGYRRLLMNPTKYQGRSAAVWEWRWQGEARAFHAIDLGFGKVGETQYALYFSTPDANWLTVKKYFDVAKRSFRADEPSG